MIAMQAFLHIFCYPFLHLRPSIIHEVFFVDEWSFAKPGYDAAGVRKEVA